MKKLIAFAIVTLMLCATTVNAQSKAAEKQALDSYLSMVKGDLVAKRDSALKTLVVLTEEQAEVFWPLQKQYDKERKQLRKRHLKLLDEFMDIHDRLTSENAEDLAGRFFDLDEDVSALRRKYFKLMSDQVSPVAAVQFLQLQAQFETMADLKISTAAPLAME